jgi:hypothetical protein
MYISSINSYLWDVLTCLYHSRSVWLEGVEYKIKDGVLYACFRDYGYKASVSNFGLNRFHERCLAMPEREKNKIRKLARQLRVKTKVVVKLVPITISKPEKEKKKTAKRVLNAEYPELSPDELAQLNKEKRIMDPERMQALDKTRYMPIR